MTLKFLSGKKISPRVYRNIFLIYWYLPYEVRRKIFHLLWPKAYNYWQALRKNTDAGVDDYSLVPLDKYRCIFVHIPKCAGLSVANSLFGNRGAGHITIMDYQFIFSAVEFSAYFKFTFVRNPWDRLLSAFTFLKMGGLTERDRDWARNNLNLYEDFNSFVEDWVNNQNVYSYPHFVPQSQFLLNPKTKKLSVDFIGRYETLEQDFNIVCKKLGIFVSLVKHNKTIGRRGEFREYYNEKTKNIVAEVYQDDIELFKYEF